MHILFILLGLLIGLGGILYVMYIGNIIHILTNPNAFIIVFGGTIGSLLITFPPKELLDALKSLIVVFRRHNPHYDVTETINFMTKLAERVNTEGIDSLVEERQKTKDRFLQIAIDMVINPGTTLKDIVGDLTRRIEHISQRHQRRIEVYIRAGTYSPIFGLLGTLIGVVQTLRSIKDPSGLAQAMSVAVATTFFGVFLANFFFLAIAGRLEELNTQETLSKRIISRAMELIKLGEAPATIREKLLTYSAEVH